MAAIGNSTAPSPLRPTVAGRTMGPIGPYGLVMRLAREQRGDGGTV